jgi:hypothetical protein
MKSFLTQMWNNGRISEEKLRSYCPLFISEQDLQEILNSVSAIS